MASAPSSAAYFPVCRLCDRRLSNYSSLQLDCGHQYHHNCLQPFLNRHLPVCPLDLQRITSINGKSITPLAEKKEINENSLEDEKVRWIRYSFQNHLLMTETFSDDRIDLLIQVDKGLDRLGERVEAFLLEDLPEEDLALLGSYAMEVPVDKTSLNLLTLLGKLISQFRAMVKKFIDVEKFETVLVRYKSLQENLSAVTRLAMKKQIRIDEIFVEEEKPNLIGQLQQAILLLEDYQSLKDYQGSGIKGPELTTLLQIAPNFPNGGRPLRELNPIVINTSSIYSSDSHERTGAEIKAEVVIRSITSKFFSNSVNEK